MKKGGHGVVFNSRADQRDLNRKMVSYTCFLEMLYWLDMDLARSAVDSVAWASLC